MSNWKGKKVCLFGWEEFKGFYPNKTGVVEEETDTECLVRIGWRKKVWTLKHEGSLDDITRAVAQKVGFCKLLT